MTDWRPLAETLAAELAGRGYLITTPALRAAFAETPRHVFVPTILHASGDGQHISEIDATDPGWLETVYSDEPLVTQFRPDDDGRLIPTSSSTRPSLMADMITELDIRPGMRVLEVGTGTGYQAAILCHLFGDDNVTTVDIDPELESLAQQRLASIGYHPSFTPADGEYDRLLITHAVDDIPTDWLRWAKPGARILTDFRATGAPRVGAWALLTVNADSTAAGTLMPDRGGFMNARTTPDHAVSGPPMPSIDPDTIDVRATELPVDVLDQPAFAFAAWRTEPTLSWTRDDDTLYLTGSDNRWATINSGSVTYGGRSDLWMLVETAYARWQTHGQPTLENYQLTVDQHGTHLKLD